MNLYKVTPAFGTVCQSDLLFDRQSGFWSPCNLAELQRPAFNGRLLPSSLKKKHRATPIRADSTVMTNANEKGVGQMQMLKAQWAMWLKSALEPFISWHCSSWERYFKGLTPVLELLSSAFFSHKGFQALIGFLGLLSFPKTVVMTGSCGACIDTCSTRGHKGTVKCTSSVSFEIKP